MARCKNTQAQVSGPHLRLWVIATCRATCSSTLPPSAGSLEGFIGLLPTRKFCAWHLTVSQDSWPYRQLIFTSGLLAGFGKDLVGGTEV